MKLIDEELGGTTPLDIVVDFKDTETVGAADQNAPKNPAETAVTTDQSESTDDEEVDDFEEEFESTKGSAQYWFTEDKMQTIVKVHDYLESLSAVGKVVSLGTMIKIGTTINDGQPLDNFKLALIYNELPERFKKIILSPYVSVEHSQVRFSVRIKDSQPNLRRNELIQQIRYDLVHKVGLQEDQFHLTSLLILYNNMLQSLYTSQISTFGATLGSLLVMFLLLFRSVKLALISMFPNVLSIAVVLGVMGWVKMPLDMMTITIASICMGMSVDNTIYYICRFREEFHVDGNYLAAMQRCQETTGHALYFASITDTIGFSILVFSNFIPSISFGVLTGVGLMIGMVSTLTLLPQLIIMLKPFGAEKQGSLAVPA